MSFEFVERPAVSVLLPTLNGERDLDRLLPALAAQRLAGGFEVRVIDSSSTDCTRQMLRRAGCFVSVIERSEFRHGATRNRLGREARGEFLVYLSQDVVPEGDDFLACLIAPLADPRVAGSTARVVPHADDDLLTRRTVLDAPEASGVPTERDLSGVDGFWSLSPEQRVEYLRFNNVASCIRRSVFETIPFPDVPFGEDVAWAARALTAGWKLALQPGATVRHAHHYTARQAFERYRVDAAFHRRIHDHRVRPTIGSVVRGILYELRADWRFARANRELAPELLRAPALRSAQVLGQYFGSRGWNIALGDGATRKFG